MIEIYNEDCANTLKRFISEGIKINLVITSPPYNTSRCNASSIESASDRLDTRYDSYQDNLSNEEYINWTVNIFELFDKALDVNGVVLYNISYGNENPTLMFDTIYSICSKTNFMCADMISWKKNSAMPNNVGNKLTRICEPVFVFCRKSEYLTYKVNKQVTSISKTGQKYYSTFDNIILARNNDGVTSLNSATYSTELVEKLIYIYAPKGYVIYDPFMGTGTTANACKMLGYDCYGSEISEKQVEYARSRVELISNSGSSNITKGSLF